MAGRKAKSAVRKAVKSRGAKQVTVIKKNTGTVNMNQTKRVVRKSSTKRSRR